MHDHSRQARTGPRRTVHHATVRPGDRKNPVLRPAPPPPASTFIVIANPAPAATTPAPAPNRPVGMSRRQFLGVMGSVVVGVTTGAVGNMLAEEWAQQTAEDHLVDDFFARYDLEQYDQAFDIGLSIIAKLPRSTPEWARWVNNLACNLVWSGQMEQAAVLLRQAGGSPADGWSALVRSNAAYVDYHRGLVSPARTLPVEQLIARHPDGTELPKRWLQLWSRAPDRPLTLFPPYALAMRLATARGDFQRAFVAAEADIVRQGRYAQGTRILFALLAASSGERTREALSHLSDLSPEDNPPSSWAHMEAERDFLLAALQDRPVPEGLTFLGQAQSAKGGYHSWTSLANVRFFLGTDASRRLRRQYLDRVVSSYQEAGRAELPAVQRLAATLR